MDIHNWIMDIHNSILILIMGIQNPIMDIHSQRVYSLLAFYIGMHL